VTDLVADTPDAVGEQSRLQRARVWSWDHRHVLLLGWLCALWWATFYRLGALRHDRFWTFGFDLGIFDQAIWLLSRFETPFITIRGLDTWGHHGNVIFLAFVPFYWLGAGAKFLLAAQLLGQLAGAVGVYLLCRDLLERGRWIGVALASAMLLHPSMQFLTWEFFHPETLAIGPIVLAYWAYRTDRRRLFWLFAAIAMSAKEDITLVFMMLGVLAAVRRQIRFGALISGVAVWWYLAVTKVLIPWRNPSGPFYEGHFFADYGGSVGSVLKNIVTNPTKVWRDITAGNRRELYIRLWAPVAFVPFIAPEVLLVAAPMLVVIVLAGIAWVQDYRYHYVAIPLAITFVATVEAMRRLRKPRLRVITTVVILFTSVLSTLSWGVGPLSKSWDRGYWPISRDENYFDILFGATNAIDHWPKAQAKREAISLLADDASVSASYNVNPHLTHRREVYEWPNPWIGINWGVCGFDNLPDPESVEWIVIDRDYLAPDPTQVYLLERLLDNEFVIRYEKFGVVAAERVADPPTPRSPAPTSCAWAG